MKETLKEREAKEVREGQRDAEPTPIAGVYEGKMEEDGVEEKLGAADAGEGDPVIEIRLAVGTPLSEVYSVGYTDSEYDVDRVGDPGVPAVEGDEWRETLAKGDRDAETDGDKL